MAGSLIFLLYFQELITWFHTFKGEVPESIHNQHPSVMCCSLLTSVFDQSVAKRLVTCLLAALRANGESYVTSIAGSTDCCA